MRGWKFHIETYGCRVNQYESEMLANAWKAQGGIETDDPKQADYILVNSCAITGRAERNARNAVFRLRRSQPDAKIILTGCAAQFYASFKPRRNANWALPDVVMPQADKSSLLRLPDCDSSNLATFLASRRRSRPILKVQDGCSQGCSYCIVPQTRGRPRSRSEAEILAEARALAKGGYSEIVLSGINLRQYHHDGDFWDLLGYLDRRLFAEFGSEIRLRISSLDPGMLTDRALEIIAGSRSLAPHLHLSVQHTSAGILKAMKRLHYNPEAVAGWLANLAQIWPVMGLGADFLVGFPGESEADLQILEEFIGSLPFSYAHVFPFSRRPGTVAAELPGQIIKAEKDRRAQRIRELIAVKRRQFLECQLALGEMVVAADSVQAEKPGRGVNQYYVPCRFADSANADCRRLLKVRPLRIIGDCIEVTAAAQTG